MLTTIRVLVTFDEETPQAAYDELCELLNIGAFENRLEYTTETYTTDSDSAERDTSELWGEE